jgi:hypothetical protein
MGASLPAKGRVLPKDTIDLGQIRAGKSGRKAQIGHEHENALPMPAARFQEEHAWFRRQP